MRFNLWLTAAILFGVAAPAGARPQGKDNRRPDGEDERIVRVIDQVRTSSETEREKLVAALRRFTAANGGPATDDEADDWFRALTGGKAIWRRDAITQKPLTELFDYLADHLDVTNDQITLAQFVDYARQTLAEEGTPPWKAVEKPALAEANKSFHEFDRDGDGLLSTDEMSNALRSERSQWDKNRDGLIDRAEYRAFFLNRTQKVLADTAKRAANGDGRATTPKGGKATTGLPAWFAQLDADRDGQVGLYEWRESGWPVADFQRLDRNGDGLLTAAEVLWAVAQAHDRGTPDAALTRQLPSDFRKKDGEPPPISKDSKRGGGGR